MSLDQVAAEVLRAYPAAASGPLVALGNRGGFSGACLWRMEGARPLCLRAWPAGRPPVERLRWLHGLMHTACRAGLSFVPSLLSTSTGAPWAEHGGRIWELTTWMPGRADFHEWPNGVRLQAACTALAQLHGVWASSAVPAGPCPAVLRRLARVRKWTDLLAGGWRPSLGGSATDCVRPWAEQAWHQLLRWTERLAPALEPWLARPVSLLPCLCDVWHDHVLFEGDAVTGLIDYGACKVDHVAADLGRLLGSLVGDDQEMWAAGLAVYGRIRPLTAEEQALARVLDWTGCVLGVANWLTWLYWEERRYEDWPAVARRLAALVERVAGWEREGASRLR